MATGQGMYDRLKSLSTDTLRQCIKFAGVQDFTDIGLENAKVVVNELRAECASGEQGTSSEELLFYVKGRNTVTEEDKKWAFTYFTDYVSEIDWALSQLATLSGNSDKVWLLAQMIYKHVGNKRVLMLPIPIKEIVQELDKSDQLIGIHGMVIRNLMPSRDELGDYHRLTILEQQMRLFNFYQSKPEGKKYFSKSLKGKEHYFKFAQSFTHDTVKRGEGDFQDGIYLAYLAQTIPIRNTSILAEKTKLFFGVLREQDLELSRRIQTDEVFHKTRIYEKDGYVLVLRARFVLIDSIRNQVIINKTPTEIAKKDVELMVRLLTSNKRG